VAVFGDAKMTTGLLDHIMQHFTILETGSDSFRLKQRKNIGRKFLIKAGPEGGRKNQRPQTLPLAETAR